MNELDIVLLPPEAAIGRMRNNESTYQEIHWILSHKRNRDYLCRNLRYPWSRALGRLLIFWVWASSWSLAKLRMEV